ncbi:hypothetical protein ACWD5R_08020 [Streptomyces sp. NPDC002514]|uniref:hypothetical protein n=1 Tax=Streptomyces sp. NPDC001270 TaxID=3364554 RepID=UPI0036A9E519
MNTNERSMQNRIASYRSWASTADRSARTAPARRRSHHDRFVEQARTLHPNGTDKQIAAAAEALKKAHYTEMARRSAQARRIRSELAKQDKAARVAQLLGDSDANSAVA